MNILVNTFRVEVLDLGIGYAAFKIRHFMPVFREYDGKDSYLHALLAYVIILITISTYLGQNLLKLP